MSSRFITFCHFCASQFCVKRPSSRCTIIRVRVCVSSSGSREYTCVVGWHFRKSCNCWVLAGWLLQTAEGAGSCWTPSGRSSGDRRGSAAGSERVPVASTCGSGATAPCPDDDRFWLVVISAVCASLRTHHTGCRSCGKPSAADNTTDTAPEATAAPIRPSVWYSWPPRQRCCCTSTGGWWDRLRSHSCSDTACSARRSSPISCRCRFLCNLVRMHTSLFGSTLPGKILGNIWSETGIQGMPTIGQKVATYRHRSRAFIMALSLIIDSGTSSADRFFRLHVESLRSTDVIGSSASG